MTGRMLVASVTVGKAMTRDRRNSICGKKKKLSNMDLKIDLSKKILKREAKSLVWRNGSKLGAWSHTCTQMTNKWVPPINKNQMITEKIFWISFSSTAKLVKER